MEPRPLGLLHRRGHVEQTFLISPPFILKTASISVKSLPAGLSCSHISPGEDLAAPSVKVLSEGALIFYRNVVSVAEILAVPAFSAYSVRPLHGQYLVSSVRIHSFRKVWCFPSPLHQKKPSGSGPTSPLWSAIRIARAISWKGSSGLFGL